MAENLNYGSVVTGAYCNSQATNCDEYGKLYTKSAARRSNTCPTGWRIPSMAEAKKMVAAAEGITTYNGNNSTKPKLESLGFNPVYGGYYDGEDEEYGLLESSMFLWTSDCLEEGSCAFETSVSYILISVGNNSVGVVGPEHILYEMRMSIRCVADK